MIDYVAYIIITQFPKLDSDVLIEVKRPSRGTEKQPRTSCIFPSTMPKK